MKYKREEMLDLNEENVKKLFTYCLATKQTPKSNIRIFGIFSDNCDVNVPKMPFNNDKLEEKRLVIRYLLGQFKSLHKKDNIMFLSDGFEKYDGTTWTNNKMALFSLYYLGCATQNFPAFWPSEIPNQFSTILKKVPTLQPTLSPNEPNFDKWCRENDIIE